MTKLKQSCFSLYSASVNSVALRKAKTVYSFGICECNGVKGPDERSIDNTSKIFFSFFSIKTYVMTPY